MKGFGTSKMRATLLKTLLGLFLFFSSVYFLVYSNFLSALEGGNLDGSASLTWRTGAAAVILFTACQFISSFAYRQRIGMTIFLDLVGSIVFWYWLIGSRFSYAWEPHESSVTFSLSWRTNLTILAVVTASLGLSFFAKLVKDACSRKHITTQTNNLDVR